MLKLPVIQGVIERRMLVNFRCDPAALAALLPSPFRPKLLDGFGVAGICLIRLGHVRPRGMPKFVGLGSENAAHRIAVEWDAATTDGNVRQGVYIPRRDTSSAINRLLGGRLFPGVQHAARFDVDDRDDKRIQVALNSDDGVTRVHVEARVAERMPETSIFRDVAAASEFFRGGSVGYSFRGDGEPPDGMELRTRRWQVTPLSVTAVESSFFDDPRRFPPGTATFDNALLMRDIEHEWHATPSLPPARAAITSMRDAGSATSPLPKWETPPR
jgi:hypothetical protein